MITTLEKKYKNNFFWKKMTPKLVIFQLWKSSKSLKKMCFQKKSFQLICADKIFKTMCGNFLKINGSWDISLPVILRFRKIVHLHKIINKTRLTKKQEHSAHCFGDDYLTDHHVKYLQDRIKVWRVGALKRVCTDYHFLLFKKVRTFRVVHVSNTP